MTKTVKNQKSKIIRRCIHIPTTDLHIRETEGDAESRIIEGYAVLFNVPSEPLWSDEDSEAREVIDASAITKELLDGQDIVLTMFHDRQLVLGRSKQGTGTLTYKVDEKGVFFSVSAPNTVDGDKAIELVKRGDISGCSFAFTTHYYDSDFVERQSVVDENGVNHITYRVKAINKIYDFTLALTPYYPDTSVETRELIKELEDEVKKPAENEVIKEREGKERIEKQIREMRHAASESII